MLIFKMILNFKNTKILLNNILKKYLKRNKFLKITRNLILMIILMIY